MATELQTTVFLVLWVASVILWDALAYGLGGNSATVTEALRRLARAWPVFPYLVAFGCGLLIHHLFIAVGPPPAAAVAPGP